MKERTNLQVAIETISKYQTKSRSPKTATYKTQELYNTLFSIPCEFNNKYSSVDEFIVNNYTPITIGIINSMYHKAIKTKKGDYIVSSCYESAKSIVESHYMDTIFTDLTQEIALCLCENKQNIVENNGIFSIMENNIPYKESYISVYVACYRALRNYLYNQKQKVDMREVYFQVSESEEKDIEIFSVHSKEYKEKLFTECEITDKINDIIYMTKTQVKRTEKNYIAEKCVKVLDLLTQGYKCKDIALKMGIGVNSVTKYRNILVKAYKDITKEEKNENTDFAATHKPNKYKVFRHKKHDNIIHFESNNNKLGYTNIALKDKEYTINRRIDITKTIMECIRPYEIKLNNMALAKHLVNELWKESTNA